jgi:hypothetical protein
MPHGRYDTWLRDFEAVQKSDSGSSSEQAIPLNRRFLGHRLESRTGDLPLGLLRATVFRHFLRFLGLRGTSQRFTRKF